MIETDAVWNDVGPEPFGNLIEPQPKQVIEANSTWGGISPTPFGNPIKPPQPISKNLTLPIESALVSLTFLPVSSDTQAEEARPEPNHITQGNQAEKPN